MTQVPDIKLNDGNTIPQLGFGVFQIDPAETAEAVQRALESATATSIPPRATATRPASARAFRASGLARDDVFITSKLDNSEHRPDDARRAFDKTLSELGIDHVDLFLVHWPLPTLYDGDYVSTWKVMEEFKADGRARSIGVSNFQVDHLKRLEAECDVVPAVNQIELHPYLLNEEVRAYGESQGIATEAWSPIAQGAGARRRGDHGDRFARGPHARAGRAALAHPARQHRVPEVGHAGADRGELPLFDFELDDDAMERMSSLDRGEDGRTGPNPDTFEGRSRPPLRIGVGGRGPVRNGTRRRLCSPRCGGSPRRTEAEQSSPARSALSCHPPEGCYGTGSGLLAASAASRRRGRPRVLHSRECSTRRVRAHVGGRERGSGSELLIQDA